MNDSTDNGKMTEKKLEQLARIASSYYYAWQEKQTYVDAAAIELTSEIVKLEMAHNLEMKPYTQAAAAAHENYSGIEEEVRDGVLTVYAAQPDKRKKTFAGGAVQVAVSKNGITHLADEQRALMWCIANGLTDFYEVRLDRKAFVAAAKKGQIEVPPTVLHFEDKHTPRIVTAALLELELQPED